MRKPLGFLGVAVIAALLVSACGSDKNSAEKSTGGTTATSSASKEPIKVAFMGIFQGQYAVPGGDNGFKLAVDEINKAGGIMGRQVEFKEFNTDITPQGATTATSLAIQYKPDVIIGYGVSSGLKASAGQISAAGIPVIHNTLDKITAPDSLGTDLSFRMQPTVAQFAGAADRFLFEELGIKSMMMINTQDAAPSDGASVILAEAKDKGIKTDHRAVSPAVTDLTEPVLAANSMKADAIWNWGYPTTDGLLLKTAASNGYGGYVMTFSAGSAAKAGLIPASILSDKIFSITAACAPQVLSSAGAKKYTAAFKAKYGNAPTTSVANENYDALHMYKLAVEKAKSTDGKAVAKALETVEFDGACGLDKSDEYHNLEHSVTIVKFPGGTETLAKQETNVSSPY